MCERPNTDRKSVHTSRRSSVGSQESNMFDSCDRYDDRFENSEFDCSHMTIGLQTVRRTVFANRSSYRSSCVNALLCTMAYTQKTPVGSVTSFRDKQRYIYRPQNGALVSLNVLISTLQSTENVRSKAIAYT